VRSESSCPDDKSGQPCPTDVIKTSIKCGLYRHSKLKILQGASSGEKRRASKDLDQNYDDRLKLVSSSPPNMVVIQILLGDVMDQATKEKKHSEMMP
jgi:hypothetical protein